LIHRLRSGPTSSRYPSLKRAHKPFDGGDWLFEIKYDGFRVMAIRDGGPTRLFTRNGYDISAKHLNIAGQLNALPAMRFVVDGELVVLDDDGRSNFSKLIFGRTGTHYFVFDLLWLDEADLRLQPLDKRKATLQDLLGSIRSAIAITQPGGKHFTNRSGSGPWGSPRSATAPFTGAVLSATG
jgi:ATP-dependent DNA ligase